MSKITRFRTAPATIGLLALFLPTSAAHGAATTGCVIDFVVDTLNSVRAPNGPTENTSASDCVEAARNDAEGVGTELGGVVTEVVTIVNDASSHTDYYVGIPDQIPLFSDSSGALDALNRCGAGPVGCAMGAEENPAQWSFQWRMTVTSSGRDLYSYGEYYEWAGTGTGGRVTYLWTQCYDYGGMYEHERCTTSHTPTGNRSSNVQGHWEYRCCFNEGVGYPKRPHAEAVVHADSTIQGTVYTG